MQHGMGQAASYAKQQAMAGAIASTQDRPQTILSALLGRLTSIRDRLHSLNHRVGMVTSRVVGPTPEKATDAAIRGAQIDALASALAAEVQEIEELINRLFDRADQLDTIA